MPSNKDIHAAREVLYDKDRRQKLKNELDSIVVLMNFDPGQPIAYNDPRVQPGAGPLWFVPANGAVDPAVLEAADRCDKVAAILRKMRDEIGDLDIDHDDRDHLKKGLNQQAKAWTTRGILWRDPGNPDPALTEKIIALESNSGQELLKVRKYLKGSD
jgi:hypothetical protein